MQFQQCRKQEMVSNIRLQHYDLTSCKQRHLIVKHHWYKEISVCYSHRKFGKDSSINEGVIAFSKKVHVFFETPCRTVCRIKVSSGKLQRRRLRFAITRARLLNTNIVVSSLKFQTLISQIRHFFFFCWKNVRRSFSHFFNKKFQCI